MRAFFLIFSMGVLLGGCAPRMDEIDSRLDNISNRTSALELKSGMPVGSDQELLRSKKIADVRTQVASLRNDNILLQGRIESLEQGIQSTGSRIDQEVAKLERKLRALKETKDTVTHMQGSDFEQEYELALKAHQDGDFDKAEKIFEVFMIKYPKSNLSDNALFWLGEGYFARKMHRSAIVKFQDLIEKFPKSDKRCEAMSRQIDSLTALSLKKEAEAFKRVHSAECKKN